MEMSRGISTSASSIIPYDIGRRFVDRYGYMTFEAKKTLARQIAIEKYKADISLHDKAPLAFDIGSGLSQQDEEAFNQLSSDVSEIITFLRATTLQFTGLQKSDHTPVLAIDGHKSREGRYTSSGGTAHLLVDLGEIENYIRQKIISGELPAPPPKTIDDVVDVLDKTMKILCRIPVDDDKREAAYKAAGGALSLTAFTQSGGPPAACRELTILGQAILSYYQIPSGVQVGGAAGRHAVVAVEVPRLSADVDREVTILDGRWGCIEGPGYANKSYSRLGMLDIHGSLFNANAPSPPIISDATSDIELQKIGQTMLGKNASERYDRLRSSSNATVSASSAPTKKGGRLTFGEASLPLPLSAERSAQQQNSLLFQPLKFFLVNQILEHIDKSEQGKARQAIEGAVANFDDDKKQQKFLVELLRKVIPKKDPDMPIQSEINLIDLDRHIGEVRKEVLQSSPQSTVLSGSARKEKELEAEVLEISTPKEEGYSGPH